MHAVFADPRTDFVFKRIFGAEARKSLLIALLNNLLEFEGARQIVDVQHLTGEQDVDAAERELSIVGVKCTDAAGRRFVVEMQVLKVEGFEWRVAYNASKAYVTQRRNAEEYPTLCDVFSVTICDFNLWTERDAQGRYKVPMLSRWRMQEQHGGEKGLPQVQYAFLELPKYEAGDAPKSPVEKWAFFFREAKSLSVVPPSLAETPFCEALEASRTAGFTLEEWEAYERAKTADQDARGALSVAHQEGELKARRDTLLRLVLRAGIPLGDLEHLRIHGCTSTATLDEWIDRVFGAKSIAEILA